MLDARPERPICAFAVPVREAATDDTQILHPHVAQTSPAAQLLAWHLAPVEDWLLCRDLAQRLEECIPALLVRVAAACDLEQTLKGAYGRYHLVRRAEVWAIGVGIHKVSDRKIEVGILGHPFQHCINQLAVDLLMIQPPYVWFSVYLVETRGDSV